MSIFIPMHFSIKEFKTIVNDFFAYNKHIISGQVTVDYHYSSEAAPKYRLNFGNLEFETVEDMHQVSKYIPIPLHGLIYKNKDRHPKLWNHLVVSANSNDKPATLSLIQKKHTEAFKSIKLIPETLAEDRQPFIICEEPLEVTEGNYTYRFLTIPASGRFRGGSRSDIYLAARNDEPIYDYLDKGYFVLPLVRRFSASNKTGKTTLVADEYNVHVAHIMLMCCIQPALVSELQDGCFINSHNAEIMRLKLEKKLSEKQKAVFDKEKANIEADYRKNTTLIVIGKLMSDDIPKTTMRDIVFTKTSAAYENITIEASDLLNVLYSRMNFQGEFDIYAISNLYSQYVEELLNQSLEAKVLTPIKINGIEIKPSITATYQRYINGIRINKDEVAKVIHRASCFHDQKDYNLFLKSISRMSIRWHDIIANGLPVKIHQMNYDELKSPTPSERAPVIKFFIDTDDHRQIKIKVDDKRAVRVQFSKLLKKVDSLNRKTNGGYGAQYINGYRYTTRNGEWCARELVAILAECCTFAEKTKNENGEEVNTVKVEITKEDLTKLLGVVQKEKEAMLKRSKEFLASAVKLTGAESIEFLGKPAYKVKGLLREYAVVIEDAKVYDYATKQYRCIVNDRHYKGAGYDDIASRLLALKNDSVMQNHIGTLKGAAQPGAENAHNSYAPDREIGEMVETMVDEVLKKTA